MSEAREILRQELLEREPRPCVGCGYCCLKATCIYGLIQGASHQGQRCKFLIWSEKRQRYLCELVVKDWLLGITAKKLDIGEGCNSPLNTWRQEVRRRE